MPIGKDFGKRFFHCQRGLQTVTAVLMLILMIVAMTEIIVAFSTYNSSIQTQSKIDSERSREQIMITEIGNRSDEITNVTVLNSGGIEVKIRALYWEEKGAATFLIDPSVSIAIGNSTTIDIVHLGLTYETDAKFVAATERGTKSIGATELFYQREEYPTGLDTSALTIGPLMLTFDSLEWAKYEHGQLGEWIRTWTIQRGQCAWRINLTNVDDKNRTLTINSYSSFTVSKFSSPSTTTWYIDAPQFTVSWNLTQPVTFSVERVTSTGVHNVFLTLFGNFSDGETYAQTIPFEAIYIE